MPTETTSRLQLDYVMPAQAQKHVTVNETFRKLDALVQAAAKSRVTADQPLTPSEGDGYLLPATPAGEDWSLMTQNSLAVFRDGEWVETVPVIGMRVWVEDALALFVFDGTNWQKTTSNIDELQNLDLLGVGTSADQANPFSAKLNAALWTALEAGNGGSGDLRFTLNKENPDDVLSLLFQSGYAARAELGLIGTDAFVLKTSTDGIAWTETLHATPDVVTVGAAQGIELSAINGKCPGAVRNLVINGDFAIAQRGSEILNPAAGDYLLDRWKLVSPSGMDCDVSQESFNAGQADVPGEPGHFMQWRLQGTAAGNPWIEHRVESVRSLSEGQATLSLFARASRTVSMTSRVRRVFGTGGSATEELERQTLALSTDWQRFVMPITVPSLDGKTLGSGHHISIELYLASGETSVDIDLADVQLEHGSIATPFDRRPVSQTLRACQRYFAKTYAHQTAPGTTTNAGALFTASNGPSTTAIFDWHLPQDMRTDPTVSFYSPSTGASAMAHVGIVDIAVSSLSASQTRVSAQTASHSANELARLHITADAEL
ncbi:DUF2793 domain-containing protein [Hyphobacterium sp.]|uniref:DUF2793 domain-containing protein n=1 Tax=Hyphobacterium sp. TaxID=2004662 RepID=UPI003BA8B04B